MPDDPSRTVVILNPKSGRGEHSESVQVRAELLGYAVQETPAAGDAIRLAREAASTGIDTIVAAGGDGTVNEVIQGINQANAFDSVCLGIIPVGTGNNFAKQIGVTNIDTAFSSIEAGDRRRIDIGEVDGQVFVNSCVAGLTADSSRKTSRELKNRFGVLAYVITTLRTVQEFETLPLAVDINSGNRTTEWVGDAICVLVGNGRRFSPRGSSQANMEDGLFDVTVVENVSAVDLVSDAVIEQLFGWDSPHIVRFQAPSLTIESRQAGQIRFSLDGEIIEEREIAIRNRPKTLLIAVGDSYDPTPDQGQ